MKFRSTAAVPAALAILWAAGPAFAQGHHAASPAAGQVQSTPHTGLYGLLDAMAEGAGQKPAANSAAAKPAHPSVAARASARRGRRHRPRHTIPPQPQPRPSSVVGHSAAATPRGVRRPAAAKRLRSLVVTYARKEGIPPALAHGVVMVESRYRPRATGHGGYIGLMQLSYRTARGMGFRGSRAALYDPETNIRYGVHYLAMAYRLSGGNLCATVSKYQGGTGVHGVTRAGAAYCGRVRHYMAAAGADGIQTAAAAGDGQS